ncbi:spore coat protein [Halobacillus salinarum]|uniref:Spore coat protein n=1 Tax=Halobacillus salinarum TaxID=2932257 RepID=A0ABY4EHH4_9BACI|nr:CotY/CotZ family spore coat protein [Halobacillus salinarum]UOQ43882.1 spore coat protein [Halobacillus salinarum]
MSCHSNSKACVKDVVRAIIDAQDEVADRDCCSTGCDQSIAELLSPSGTNGNNATTIPFLLYCDCKPFIGTGLVRDNGTYDCIETPVFKACKFVEGSDTCVQLELLQPVYDASVSQNCVRKDGLCSLLEGVTDFYSTRVCITVDLNCFCAISCLDPIRPLSNLPVTRCSSMD